MNSRHVMTVLAGITWIVVMYVSAYLGNKHWSFLPNLITTVLSGWTFAAGLYFWENK
jgi:hypothetical protein